VTNFRLLDRQLQSLHMASRKRQYRHRVRCEECNKEIDSDYKEVHSRLVHNGKKVKCHPVMESSDLSQSKISTFFVKSNMTTKDDDNPNLRLELKWLGTIYFFLYHVSQSSKESLLFVIFSDYIIL
jgi:hypothetical protein